LRKLKLRRLTRAILGVSAIVAGQFACASPGIPPGGPVDKEAPKVLSIVPDSGKVGITPSEVLFRFDKVVSERPASAPSLEALFLISPRDGTPNVSWHRKEISVRPHRRWRANTAYTVTMLPGIADLRGNVRNTGAAMIFSTGPTIPASYLSGTVFNWLTGTAAPRAFVEARSRADSSIVYVAVADSMGTFLMRSLAPGQYRVRGIIDANNNNGLDPREAWDTTTVAVTDSGRAEVYAFPHDSVGARLASIGLRDSVTLELIFDHAIDVNQRFTPQSIIIKTSDSVSVPVISVTKAEVAADTTRRVKVHATRGIPSASLLIRIGVPIKQPTTVRVRTIDVRGLDGVGYTSDRVVTLAPPPPPAPLPARAPASGGKSALPALPPPPPPPPPPPGSLRR
jgi:Bacterial Ig-like domain